LNLIEMKITTNRLELVDSVQINTNGVEADTVHVTLSSDIKRLSWTFYFVDVFGQSYFRTLNSSTLKCLIPWEAIQTDGELLIGATGTDGDSIVTTNYVPITLTRGTEPSGIEPTESDLMYYEQLVAQLPEIWAKIDENDTAQTTAVDAVREEVEAARTSVDGVSYDTLGKHLENIELALSAGLSSGDSDENGEVKDARRDYSGKVYSTLGEHIRAVDKQLSGVSLSVEDDCLIISYDDGT
jgi:hypothetical protein